MISNKTKYGLNALFYLSRNQARGSVLIADLARDEGIPKKFLEQILLALKNDGILESKKGKGGGYHLALSPSAITIGRIIRVLDGTIAPVSCVSQTAYRRCKECKDERYCGIRLVMKDVRDAMANIIDNTTLADVIIRVDALSSGSTANYDI